MRLKELQLEGAALKCATDFTAAFGDGLFTDGRRTLIQQCSRMALNVMRNAQWIVQTYLPSSASAAAQQWVDDCTRPLSLGQIEQGLYDVLSLCSPEELSHLSHHLSGFAFDVTTRAGIPQVAWLAREVPIRGGKFLQTEGGLHILHAQWPILAS